MGRCLAKPQLQLVLRNSMGPSGSTLSESFLPNTIRVKRIQRPILKVWTEISLPHECPPLPVPRYGLLYEEETSRQGICQQQDHGWCGLFSRGQSELHQTKHQWWSYWHVHQLATGFRQDLHCGGSVRVSPTVALRSMSLFIDNHVFF